MYLQKYFPEERDKAMEKNRVTVIGLGFVGLPLALSFAMKGHKVTGLDVNEALTEDLNRGKTECLEQYHGRCAQDVLRKALTAGTFKATASYAEAAKESNAYIVTVGLPVERQTPKLDFLESCATDLGQVLEAGDLVLIRSTVVPGTTEEKVVPLLEQESGLTAGRDFFVGYASERIAEGKAFDEFENMPTVVSGVNKESAEKSAALLRLISKAEIFIASDIKVVEAAKVFENVSRDVNIALANQFAQFCQSLGIDTFETFQIANTHTRVNLLTPGPGVGGYCLPNAYYYLRPKHMEMGIDLPLLSTARAINDEVPQRLVGRLVEMMSLEGKYASGSVAAVLGLAMKDYSNDDRISPAHAVCQALLEAGMEVRAFDPVVGTGAAYAVETMEEAVTDADALVILAKQEIFEDLDLMAIKEAMKDSPVIIDAKHLLDKKEAEALGFKIFVI